MPGTSRFNGARSMSSSRQGDRLNGGERPAVWRRGGDIYPLAPGISRMIGEGQVHIRLPAEAESVTAAHHCVFGVACSLDPDTLDDVRLLISELVTNAIRHAGLRREDWIELVVDVGHERVRVEVRDPGPGFDPANIPASKRPRGGPRSGWGLEFLRRIASRWGVENDGLTVVWFELDLHPAPGTKRPRRGRG